ncbi:hypothetical protein EKO27_g8596 [Xylaria grammica]|uniref:Uncharacterized protein n=1 Tax=Xylaria grammica TaxID=363999 RepID=A0A439CWF6_9PEZI|nr:hypothetical protein EKO27_g8596 [Xylaria grammica]
MADPRNTIAVNPDNPHPPPHPQGLADPVELDQLEVDEIDVSLVFILPRFDPTAANFDFDFGFTPACSHTFPPPGT